VRFFALALLAFCGSANAQSVDCDAVKNTFVPVMLAYHLPNGMKMNTQAYRDKSGTFTIWTQRLPYGPDQSTVVSKISLTEGMLSSTETWTTFRGKYSHFTGKYAAEGLPKNFDRRSNIQYKNHAVSVFGDDSTEEKTVTVSYQFKSEEEVAVGSCFLRVIHGEFKSVDDATGRAVHHFQAYYPELHLGTDSPEAEPVADSVSTVFSKIQIPK
jgi:hypothetical protein